MKQFITTCFVVLVIIGSSLAQQKVLDSNVVRAKFEPKDGKCIVFIGQDMGSIGGVDGYNDGYADHFNSPAGITIYTNFRTGDKSFGHTYRGNDGIFQVDNWGAGDCYADLQVNSPKFKNSALAIGLEIVNAEKKIINGEVDHLIEELGTWIKTLAPRPVFVRIGYEFDGHGWNHYSSDYYPKAWRHIVDYFETMGVENTAYVWQSKGNGTSAEEMEYWYPGDKYVDWCGYSYFTNPDQEMLKFARKHNKPVFIAEATPTLTDEKGKYMDCDLSNPEIANKLWTNWFEGFFRTIEENGDVVKAFSYINCNWKPQAMWVNNPTFQQVDSRIHESEYLSAKWLMKMKEARYLEAMDNQCEKR